MQRTEAPLPWRQGLEAYRRHQAVAAEIAEQAARVRTAEDTWRETTPGTHAERAAWDWLEGQREALAQMIVDARHGKGPIEPRRLVRRWSWRVFLHSRFADAALLCLAVAAIAGALAVAILLMDGVVRP